MKIPYPRKNFELCLVKYFLFFSLTLLVIQDASSTTDMKCEIKSFCSPSGCQYNKSMTVDPGSNITRNCSISTGKLAKGMIWKQAKQEVQNSTGSSDLVLQESNSAKDSDNILCRCTAVNFARTLEIVWSSPTPDKIIEGKRKDLECHFSGWPLPHEVHWYKDGQLITNETEGIFHSEDKKWKKGEEILWSTLHLPPGREEQEGDYNCSARNSIHGWSSSVSLADEIEMMYECFSRKNPIITLSEIVASIFSNVNLTCWYDFDDGAFCPEDLFWKLNDNPEQLSNSGKKYKVELKNTHTKCKKEFTLSIFNVTESDEGTYSCHWRCDSDNEIPTKGAIDLKVFAPKGNLKPTEQATTFSQSNTVLISPTYSGSHRDWLLPIIILSAGSVTLLIMLFVRFVVKKKWKSSYNMRKPGLLEEDLINRLFISYSSKDFGWVTENLISILEKHSIDYSIHSRDFEIGRPIVQNMADSVYGSRQVLIVLSENYLASNFCREELHMAVQRGLDGEDSSLIFVMIKNLKKNKLPTALRRKRLLDFDKHKKKQDWEEKILREISMAN